MTKWHRRILTIYRISGLSWVLFAKRWKIIWSERLDSRGTPKLDPCWKSQPVTCKVNMEWKSELNLWTKTILTRGSEFLMELNKSATDLIDKESDDNEQETWNEDGSICVCKPKAKAKPRRPSTSCSSSRTVPILERTWIDIELGAQSNQAYPVAKRLNTLLRHGDLPREEDGAIEFWRLKDDLRNKFEYSPQHWSDDVWKSKMAGGRKATRKGFQYCTDPSGQEILCLRALQSHSGRNPIDPSLQDNVLIPNSFFEYIYLFWMCSQFTLHHKFRIDTGTVFLQKWKKAPGYGVLGRHTASSTERIEVLSNKIERNHSSRNTLPAYCILKVVVMKSGEVKNEKVYASPRPPPKISYKDYLDVWFGFWFRWKQQRYPTNPTKPKPRSW